MTLVSVAISGQASHFEVGLYFHTTLRCKDKMVSRTRLENALDMYVGILPDGVTLDDLEHCVLGWQLPEDASGVWRAYEWLLRCSQPRSAESTSIALRYKGFDGDGLIVFVPTTKSTSILERNKAWYEAGGRVRHPHWVHCAAWLYPYACGESQGSIREDYMSIKRMSIQGSRKEFTLGDFLKYREKNDPASDEYGLKSLRTELRHLGCDEWIEVSCSVGVSGYRSLNVVISAYAGMIAMNLEPDVQRYAVYTNAQPVEREDIDEWVFWDEDLYRLTGGGVYTLRVWIFNLSEQPVQPSMVAEM